MSSIAADLAGILDAQTSTRHEMKQCWHAVFVMRLELQNVHGTQYSAAVYVPCISWQTLEDLASQHLAPV